MSLFVYVSHRDTVEALVAAKELITCGHFPFIPQLNRLIAGRSNEEWENYFKMWLFRCDCILLTESSRRHEEAWAMENKLPICKSVKDVNNIKLPPFGELGRKFGERVASILAPNEEWRTGSIEDEEQRFKMVAGVGADPILVAARALMLWDRRTNG